MSLSCVVKKFCGYPVYGGVLCFLTLCDTLGCIGFMKKKKKKQQNNKKMKIKSMVSDCCLFLKTKENQYKAKTMLPKDYSWLWKATKKKKMKDVKKYIYLSFASENLNILLIILLCNRIAINCRGG